MMSSRKIILVPIDFSPPSELALEFASRLARAQDGVLLILHVVEGLDALAVRGLGRKAGEHTEEELARRLSQTRPSDPAVAFAQKLAEGSAVDEICRCAEEEGAAMIVMGTHGRRGWKRMLLGSVAEGVIRQAACPVVTVRGPVTRAA